MGETSKHKKQLKELLTSQKLAVLATQNEGKPYASLVAFAATRDLKHLVFATTRSTRKFANLSSNSHVALLIDNASNRESDFHRAVAVTATGEAGEVEPERRRRFVKLYIDKHPHLREFVGAPTCALVKVKVDAYYMVSRFQNVVELHPTP